MKWNSYSDKIRHFRLTSSRGPSLGAIHTFSFHSESCHVRVLTFWIPYWVIKVWSHHCIHIWNSLCVEIFALFFCAGQQSHLPRNHYQHEVLRHGCSLPAMWQEEFSTLSQSSSFQINKKKKMEVVHHNKSLLGHAVFSWLISLGNYSSTASDLKTAGILYVNTVLLSALCFVSHDLPSDY